MTDENLTFSDFSTDKDGDYSKAQFMALADKLLREGRNPRKLFLAMYRAAAASSIEHSIVEHYSFTKTVADETGEYMPELDEHIDRQLEDLDA